MAKSHHWQKTAIAAAATALLTLSSSGALALSLGRITVQSSLGEPLRAEIEVPDISAEEAASLRTAVALPEAFTSAGLEYNAALSSLQASLQRRADGRAYIKLISDRAINDPFVDMIIEASWSSGRIVRDYTMLFDPPSLRKPTTPAPTLPLTSTPAIVRAPMPAPVTVERGRSESPPPLPRPTLVTPVAKAATPIKQGEKQVVVKPGDTATRIAANTKESGVSLDQMLVAMLKGNPDAFINNNVDRLRSGSVINVPTSEQARALEAPEASRVLRAQSKDFDSFRRALAANAPASTVASPDRKTSGKIESSVIETKPAAVAPDKLTLSKGAVQAKSSEAQLAKERAEKDAATRAAEIAKNIEDLKKAGSAVTAASAQKVAASAAVTAPAPAVSAPASAPAVVPTLAPAPSPLPAPLPTPVASAVAPPPELAASSVKKETPPAQPVAETKVFDDLLENPVVLIVVLGLLALLGAFGIYRMRRRNNNAAQVDSSFLESRLQPDSFFGASGGQRVDTNNEEPVSGSSIVYSASQLDAADDVDPVAEADVYLAYGRDLQAEEILKEALRTNPGRLAIYTKLLEIFAKRRDAHSFEATAIQAHKLTGSGSPDWTRICQLGLPIDPNNALYQHGGVSAPANATAFTAKPSAASSYGASTLAQSALPELAQGSSVDLDLDLDFSIDDEPASAISDVTGGSVTSMPLNVSLPVERTVKMEAPPSFDLDALDFNISSPAPLDMAPQLPEISVNVGGLGMASPTAPLLPEFSAIDTMSMHPPGHKETVEDGGMLEFDMSSLSLDLESSTTARDSLAAAPDTSGEDPLETKLALAEEFVSIGDEDGARALIEEVVAEATGDMRLKAQRALANLS
ncbi:MAG: fimbrial protein FimV [Candidatus Saccharibacteria bacterium]|nr:fimbrial protein FimV [Rhodoferax sp.]